VTILHGPSTIGKTSLLHAGVLPLLSIRKDFDLLPVGGLALSEVVPSSRNRYSFALLSRWGWFEEASDPDMSVSDFLLARSAALKSADTRSVLAVIDHFEGLFDAFPVRQPEREEFIDQLTEAISKIAAFRLLIIINDEYLTRLRSYERRTFPFPSRRIRLSALTPVDALEAITRPLAGTGRSFDAGVAEGLVERLGSVADTDMAGSSAPVHRGTVQPLFLQIVCQDIWTSLGADEELITARHLHAYGNIDQAIGRYYESAVHAAAFETGESEERLRIWVESNFITENGTRGTVCRGLVVTAGMPNQVADVFVRLHILASEERFRSTWYQLGHDRMIGPIQDANLAWRAANGTSASRSAKSVSPEQLISAAETALAAGNFPAAHRFASEAANCYKRFDNIRRAGYASTLQASISRAEGDNRATERYLQDALSEFSLLQDRELIARSLSALAEVYFADGDFDQAAQVQRAAVDRLPAYVDALIGLAFAEWYAGSPADAEATFALALGVSASAARATGGRGQVLAELGEYDKALANLDPVVFSVLPLEEEVDARSARAMALSGLGRTEEADKELAMASRQAPGRARTHRRAGRIAMLRQQNEHAIAEFRLALDAKPPLPTWDEENARRFLTQLLGAHTLLCR
jgi:tetratricopeptide (TPR) repeat protein